MRIGEVAHRAGVSVKTLRYYERVGIVAPPTREPNGYRSYEPGVLDRLAFTKSAQAMGLTLGEIREVIAFRERGETPCTHVLALIEQRASEIEQRIAELENLRGDLLALASRGESLDPLDCDPASVCHVIGPDDHRAR